ncbi:MAG: SH3 domain-containing protein [Gemella sp.]|nr:SH3 domain-containing protein [Gemella sp.]
MARRIFEDNDGLYFRAYDKNRRLVKVYCDEEGNPIKGRKVVPIILEEESVVGGAVAAGSGLSLKKVIPWLISLMLVALVAFVGYFAYSKYANANPTVDISSNYDISFAPTGYNGEAKAGIKVNKIPTVSNVKDETQKKTIEDVLNNPRVSYSKTEGLRNGDDVEVTVVLDETKVKASNLEVVGTYKKTFKVEGLGEKPAVAGIDPTNSNQSSETTSSENSEQASSRSNAAERATTRAVTRARTTSSADVPQGVTPVQRTIKPTAANIRSGAGTGNAVAGTVARGRAVTEIRRVQNAKGETWSQVSYGNGRQGWIRSDLLD